MLKWSCTQFYWIRKKGDNLKDDIWTTNNKSVVLTAMRNFFLIETRVYPWLWRVFHPLRSKKHDDLWTNPNKSCVTWAQKTGGTHTCQARIGPVNNSKMSQWGHRRWTAARWGPTVNSLIRSYTISPSRALEISENMAEQHCAYNTKQQRTEEKPSI